jgi:hypothetical protein
VPAPQEDFEHLRLLSIFHYIVGGLAAMFSLFPVIHLVLGIAMLTGWEGLETSREDALFVRMMGGAFTAISGAIIVSGFALATCIVLTGRYLVRRTRYTFCLVVAAVECAFAPFGTVLGVFTILVLQRPSVKQLFGR